MPSTQLFRAFIVVAVLAVLAPPGASGAMSGGASAEAPSITSVRCSDGRTDACAVGARLAIRGGGLAQVEEVVFTGRRGEKDNRTARPLKQSAKRLVVTVPASAPSGPVLVPTTIGTARSAALEIEAASTTTAATGFVFPLRGRYEIGETEMQRFGGARGHQGQDIFTRCGKKVRSVIGGTVHNVDYHSAAGNYVVVDGTDGRSYAYMHLLETPLVAEGDEVLAGQQLGLVGETGRPPAATCTSSCGPPPAGTAAAPPSTPTTNSGAGSPASFPGVTRRLGVLAAIVGLWAAPAHAATPVVTESPFALDFDGAFDGGTLGYLSLGVWHDARSATVTRKGDVLRLAIATDAAPMQATITPVAEGVTRVEVDTPGDGVRVGFAAEEDERFLGFGERSDAVVRKAGTVHNRVTEGPFQDVEKPVHPGLRPAAGLNDRDDATYFPLPWLLSTRGAGLLVRDDAVDRPTSAARGASRSRAARLTLRVFAGPTPGAALAASPRASAASRPPPRRSTSARGGSPRATPRRSSRSCARPARRLGRADLHALPAVRRPVRAREARARRGRASSTPPGSRHHATSTR